jgi:hypothetical protein
MLPLLTIASPLFVSLPEKNQGRSSNSDPTNNGKVDEIKQSKEGMPEPNADSTESTGGESGPGLDLGLSSEMGVLVKRD